MSVAASVHGTLYWLGGKLADFLGITTPRSVNAPAVSQQRAADCSQRDSYAYVLRALDRAQRYEEEEQAEAEAAESRARELDPEAYAVRAGVLFVAADALFLLVLVRASRSLPLCGGGLDALRIGSPIPRPDCARRRCSLRRQHCAVPR